MFKSNKKIAIPVFVCVIIILIYWNNLSRNGGPYITTETHLRIQKKECCVNFNDTRNNIDLDIKMVAIYYITPTYLKPEQIPDLVKLSHTLMHVPRLHWIVADEEPFCSSSVLEVLRQTNLPFTYLSSPKPYKSYPRGVSSRHAAVSWLKQYITDGVFYFGEADNTVDLMLFEEIRKTKIVSMFPVGLDGEFGVSAPLVKEGKVIGFFTSRQEERKFPVDISSFAVNIQLLKRHDYTKMPQLINHDKDPFLDSLDLKIKEIEPLANNCSKIFVWLTKTKANLKKKLHINPEMFEFDNLARLMKQFDEEKIIAQTTHGVSVMSIVEPVENSHIVYLHTI